MKGGKVCEVIAGKRIGKYAQVPNDKQMIEFLNVNKVWAAYFDDSLGQIPVIEADIKVCGLTSFDNLKIIGYYD